MSVDENELRRALEARSGEVSPEYRARLRQALAEPKPASSWMAAIAVLTVTILTATSVGILVVARSTGRISHGPPASGARVVSPSPTESPIPAPTTAFVSAPSRDVVWILVDYDHLYRSTDLGSHWEAKPMPPSFGVRPSISFVNASEGWLLAPGSRTTQCQEASADIWHTTDGAATWQRLQPAGLGSAQCKEAIYFPDVRHGFITAWDDGHQPTIYWSSDGGVGWKRATLPDPPDFRTADGGFTLRVEWIKGFGNTFYLEAYGRQGAGSPYPDVPDRQYIFRSTDGGGTWQWKQKVATRGTVLVTESRWLEATAPGHLDESTNGGQQFHPFDSNFGIDASVAGAQILFADADLGYATAGGILQETTDGGANWTPIATPGVLMTPSPSPSPSQIPMPTEAQVSAPSADVVWALVGGQYLFRSTDQGATWHQRTWVPYRGGGGNPVTSFVDDLHGWALFPGVPSTQCQQAGAQLWATSDGAATWNIVAEVTDQSQDPKGLAFEQCKEYMAFVDAEHGFVAAHDTAHRPAVYRTFDGGITWAPSTLPDPPGFVTNGAGNALQVMNMRGFGSVLLAVAGNGNGAGYAFRSTDSGATWTYQATLPAGPLEVTFVTANRWLLIGNDGSGRETTDAGKSWNAWSSDYQDAAGVPSTFVFATPLIGYGTVRGGVHRSTDGGAHWLIIKASWP